jgi:hypothetical protein
MKSEKRGQSRGQSTGQSTNLALRCFEWISRSVDGSAAGPDFSIEQKGTKVTKYDMLRRCKIFIAAAPTELGADEMRQAIKI